MNALMVVQQDSKRAVEPYMRFAKSGRRYYYLTPEKEPPLLQDLLYGLGGIVRGCGQWSRDYDVLRHSWVCYQHAFNQTRNDEFSIGVGYHDLPEATMHDLPSPLKVLLPDYAALYSQQENYLFDLFKIPRLTKMSQDACHLIDRVVGDVEGEMWVKDWVPIPADDPRDLKVRADIRELIHRSIELHEDHIISQLMYELGRYHKLAGLS